MGFKFRDYQSEAVEAPFKYFAAGHTGNPVVAKPTGTGKSCVIAGIIRKAFETSPNLRVLMVTHVQELIEQNFKTLMKVWPACPAGIYSAGIGRKEHQNPVTYCGIQSVAKKAHLFGHIDIAIVDECHLVSPDDNTSYKKFFEELKFVNPNFKVLGLTATPFRRGLGLITDGDIFDDICCDMTGIDAFNRFIYEGYLSPLVPKRTSLQLDLDGVRMARGDFNNVDLQKVTDKEEVTWAALQEVVAVGEDRKHWLIFATGVSHCEHIVEMLDAMGIPAVAIHSKLTKAQRKEGLEGAFSGKYRAIVNNNVLTTGFDFPGIDLIAVLRATASPGLWVQMLGRGTRVIYAEGFDLETTEGRLAAIQEGPKQNCLVLDFAGNTSRLGPINDPMIPKRRGKGGGSAPVRVCPVCETYMHTSVRNCTQCGYAFPVTVNFNESANTEELITDGQPEIEIFSVSNVVYSPHKKKDRPTSLKVSYSCGLRTFTSYVCLEHGGYAAKKARDWWRLVWPKDREYFVPQTTAKALDLVSELSAPTHIEVWVNKKHPEILAYDYTGTGFEGTPQTID